MAVEERPPLTIVVDTNVIVAALLQDGIVRKLLLERPGTFVTTETCIQEIWEHSEEWNRRGVPVRALRRAVGLLTADFLSVRPRLAYRTREPEARHLVQDPDDFPVVALALAVRNDGVWTFNTKDFSDRALLERIRVLTTADVRDLLEADRTA